MPTKYAFRLAIFLSAAVCSCAPAQTTQTYSAFVTGTGYVVTPQIYPISPGQIVTFFVAGLPMSNLENVVAAVTIQGTAQSASVLSARPVGNGTLAVTVQIPFNVVTQIVNPLSLSTTAYSIQFGETASAAGGPCGENVCTPPIPLVPVFANPHIISTCDIFYSDVLASASTPCQQAVTHQNGQLVTVSAPAKPGEVVTIWALGLGVPAGGITPNMVGPVAMNDITLQANFILNPYAVNLLPDAPPTPYEFAGLPSAATGLYQINFAIPQPPVGTLSCIAAVNGIAADSSGNLSISIGRAAGQNTVFDGGTGFVFFGLFSGIGQNICVTVI